MKVWWTILYAFCWKFSSVSSSEIILKIPSQLQSYHHEFGVPKNDVDAHVDATWLYTNLMAITS